HRPRLVGAGPAQERASAGFCAGRPRQAAFAGLQHGASRRLCGVPRRRVDHAMGLCVARRAGGGNLAHDPEKWIPVFRKDHAPLNVVAMARACLAVRHVAFEDLGLLGPLVSARGYDVRYHDAGIDRFDGDTLIAPDLVIVLGGPIGVYEADAYPFITGEIAAIAGRLAANKPMLGICLGAQLMAAALGARVAPGPVKEIGWAPLSLTAAGQASVLAPLGTNPVLHWHGD